MKGRGKKFALAPHGVLEQILQGIHERPSSKNALDLQLSMPKVGGRVHCFALGQFSTHPKMAERKFFASTPIGAYELQAWKLHDMSNANFFVFGLPPLVSKLGG